MKIPNTIQNELRELNSTLPFERTQPYTVPDGYFNDLASTIMAKIKAQEVDTELSKLSPRLAAIPKKIPFSVPDNYFGQNANTISNLVKDDVLPDKLTTMGKAMPYQVPAHYFENLPQQILNKVSRPRAKVVAFNRTRWMRYAAAAVITGAMIIGGITYFNNKNTIDLSKQPHEWIAKKLKNVSNQDLEEFIQTTEPITGQQRLAKNAASGKEVRKLLQDISTSELDAFLKSVPHDNDELSVIN